MARLKSARFSRVLPAASFLAALLAVAPVWAGESAAPVTVTYGISIAHVPIGTAKFTETLKDQTFHLHLGAEFSGLVRMFFAPDLSADSEGSVVNERIVPKHYQMLVNHPDDPQKVSMSLVGGTVVSAELQPPLTVRADRVPVLPEHKHGVVDPLSGFLIPMKPGAEITPELCTRVIPVFDGGGRFDITLSPGAAATLDALALGATDYFTKPSGPGGVEEARRIIWEQLVPAVKALGVPRSADLIALAKKAQYRLDEMAKLLAEPPSWASTRPPRPAPRGGRSANKRDHKEVCASVLALDSICIILNIKIVCESVLGDNQVHLLF